METPRSPSSASPASPYNTVRAAAVIGALIAIGLAAAAWLHGWQLRQSRLPGQTISVKGLAEKPIAADSAEWRLTVNVKRKTAAEAIEVLRVERAAVIAFLTQAGFTGAAVTLASESVDESFDERRGAGGDTIRVPDGFLATQAITVTSKDVAAVEQTYRSSVKLKVDGRAVAISPPGYLVSTLEDVKMSLIGAATQNAQKRAAEFASQGGVKVGPMRSASQGAFYILPPSNAGKSPDDYGGAYDKTTIPKIARVVVTIDYSIER
jgi:uncharacterized protein